jgi:hypothetical protein
MGKTILLKPTSGNKTVVAGTDDATVNGQGIFYIGTNQYRNRYRQAD